MYQVRFFNCPFFFDSLPSTPTFSSNGSENHFTCLTNIRASSTRTQWKQVSSEQRLSRSGKMVVHSKQMLSLRVQVGEQKTRNHTKKPPRI